MRRQGLLACTRSLITTALAVLVAVQCGGGSQTAKDPNSETTNHADDTAPKWDSNSTPTPSAKSSGGGTDPAARRGDQYDKEQTEVSLKRGMRQVKDNCGHAKDSDGKLTGPYGKATVTLTLGHNGHMKDVKVPSPFAGKPTGNCIVQCFDNVIFPPWAGADTTIDWEVEVVQPK